MMASGIATDSNGIRYFPTALIGHGIILDIESDEDSKSMVFDYMESNDTPTKPTTVNNNNTPPPSPSNGPLPLSQESAVLQMDDIEDYEEEINKEYDKLVRMCQTTVSSTPSSSSSSPSLGIGFSQLSMSTPQPSPVQKLPKFPSPYSTPSPPPTVTHRPIPIRGELVGNPFNNLSTISVNSNGQVMRTPIAPCVTCGISIVHAHI